MHTYRDNPSSPFTFLSLRLAGAVWTPTAQSAFRSAAAGAVAALLLMSLCAVARAGGPRVQGPELQGHVAIEWGAPGRARAPVRLLGVVERIDESPRLLAIHEFRGDRVEATVWQPGQSHRRLSIPARELLGLRWSARHCDRGRCGDIELRISGEQVDWQSNTMATPYADNADVWLYRVEYASVTEAGESWRPYCMEDAHGRSLGLFVNGTWRADGDYSASGYTLACTRGAIGKCVRDWGYKPWKRIAGPAGSPAPMAALHRACVRAARADYCGDGRSFTREGRLIEMIDEQGLNRHPSRAGFSLEAVFDQHGARRVERLRGSAHGSSKTEVRCPAGRGWPRSGMVGDTAVIQVRSRPSAGVSPLNQRSGSGTSAQTRNPA